MSTFASGLLLYAGPITLLVAAVRSRRHGPGASRTEAWNRIAARSLPQVTGVILAIEGAAWIGGAAFERYLVWGFGGETGEGTSIGLRALAGILLAAIGGLAIRAGQIAGTHPERGADRLVVAAVALLATAVAYGLVDGDLGERVGNALAVAAVLAAAAFLARRGLDDAPDPLPPAQRRPPKRPPPVT